ncbi:MAG: aminotransferase class I/II-fold pyridoxal phosphate-dependent enzyme [candidate division Zixibacteria bacterium]|nr:aminotransferase class I/II-fold pyridoxal phosphate-dependent enzyme [candidate division Zixibacteria bacterium]
MINIPKWVKDLQPYKPGKPISELVDAKNLKRIVKLASNENPLGPSPKAIEAIKKFASESHRYVDPASTELVKAIARKYDKKSGQIICGHGVDNLLTYYLMAFTREHDEVLTSGGTFIGLYVNTNKIGRQLTTVPLRDYSIDLNAIYSNISPRTKIIYLANPNNPTGTIFSRGQFEEFMIKVPKDIIVLLDEAYSEYVPPGTDLPNGTDYDYENLIVSRSFSKCHGLAGLRVGFAIGPENLIKELYKVKLTFEPNHCAQVAAAAALEDNEFIARTIELNKKSLALMIAKFDQLGIDRIESYANFILMLMPSEEIAADFCDQCLKRGLILRHVRPFGIANGVRINSGTEDETIFAIDVITEVYRKLLDSQTAHAGNFEDNG